MIKIKKKDWFYLVVLPLFSVWIIDRITKYAFLDFTGLEQWWIFGWTLHYNSGAILGLFSNLPPILRIVSLSTSGGFLIFIFLVIQIFLPMKAPFLRFGMSLLLGGILGNIADRLYWGHVVDFLFFSAFNYDSPIFNLADAFQWVGYFVLIYGFVVEGQALWPEDNSRQSYWVDKKFQIRYCLRLVSFGLAFAIIAGIYSYTFLKVSLLQIGPSSMLSEIHKVEVNKILNTFVIIYTFVSVVFLVILFFSGIAISHRVAGPVYAFQKFLSDLMAGKIRSLKLRSNDEFPQLEDTANQFVKKFAHLLKKNKKETQGVEKNKVKKPKAEQSEQTTKEAGPSKAQK